MSSWIEGLKDEDSLSVALERSRQQIYDRYNQQREQEQLKKEILAECAKMIEQRVNFQIQNNAMPQLKELDQALKNLGKL